MYVEIYGGQWTVLVEIPLFYLKCEFFTQPHFDKFRVHITRSKCQVVEKSVHFSWIVKRSLLWPEGSSVLAKPDKCKWFELSCRVFLILYSKNLTVQEVVYINGWSVTYKLCIMFGCYYHEWCTNGVYGNCYDHFNIWSLYWWIHYCHFLTVSLKLEHFFMRSREILHCIH